jgi:D-alanyl-D-alanine carboxypeptidase
VNQKLSETETKAIVGNYRIQGDSMHAITEDHGELYIQRAPGPKRQLTTAEGGLLYFLTPTRRGRSQGLTPPM